MSYKTIHKNKAFIILNEAQMLLGEMQNSIEIVFDDYEDIIAALREHKIEKENLFRIQFIY